MSPRQTPPAATPTTPSQTPPAATPKAKDTACRDPQGQRHRLPRPPSDPRAIYRNPANQSSNARRNGSIHVPVSGENMPNDDANSQ
jgi:hypothetical protein